MLRNTSYTVQKCQCVGWPPVAAPAGEDGERWAKALISINVKQFKQGSIHYGKDLISGRREENEETISGPLKPQDYSTFGGREEQCGFLKGSFLEETRLLHNDAALSCLIGGWEEAFKILVHGQRSGPRRWGSPTACVCVCVYGGMRRVFRKSLT